jgi:hypothetical protein
MSELALELRVYTRSIHKDLVPVEIAGSNLDRVEHLGSSSDVHVTGSSCTVALNLADSSVNVEVTVEGSRNIITVNGGRCRLRLLGSDNSFVAVGSKVLGEDILGRSNYVIREMY